VEGRVGDRVVVDISSGADGAGGEGVVEVRGSGIVGVESSSGAGGATSRSYGVCVGALGVNGARRGAYWGPFIISQLEQVAPLVAPVAAMYFPTPQSEQAETLDPPVAGLNLPAGQSTQAELVIPPVGLYWAAGQS